MKLKCSKLTLYGAWHRGSGEMPFPQETTTENCCKHSQAQVFNSGSENVKILDKLGGLVKTKMHMRTVQTEELSAFETCPNA